MYPNPSPMSAYYILASLEQAPGRKRPVPLPNLAINSIPPPHALCTSTPRLPSAAGHGIHAIFYIHRSQLDGLTHVVSKALTVALVLHPVACALAFTSLVVTLFALFRRRRYSQVYGTERDGRSRFTSIITFAIILPAALLATVVFIIDIVSVAIARNKLRDALNDSPSVDLTWDSAVS